MVLLLLLMAAVMPKMVVMVVYEVDVDKFTIIPWQQIMLTPQIEPACPLEATSLYGVCNMIKCDLICTAIMCTAYCLCIVELLFMQFCIPVGWISFVHNGFTCKWV